MLSFEVTVSMFCTNGASAMVDEGRGFAALIKRENPAIEITHCCLHQTFIDGAVRHHKRLYPHLQALLNQEP